MSDLLDRKFDRFYEEDFYIYPSGNAVKNKYGYVRLKNPHYMEDDDERKFLIRKPTPKERREIIINTVIECNGRSFRIPVLAERLGVSDRTLQTALRQLQKDGLIEIIPRHNKNGAQKGNAYRYIGQPCEKYGSGLTLQILHSANQDVGFRDWTWDDYEFYHDKCWHDIYLLCQAKIDRRRARREYLERNNLPLIVPDDIKYVVLRYCYWKGKESKLQNDYLFSKDGTVKLALFPLERVETVRLCGNTYSVAFGGSENNPEISIYNVDKDLQLGAFMWFDDSIIVGEAKLDDGDVKQHFIVVDFTTK